MSCDTQLLNTFFRVSKPLAADRESCWLISRLCCHQPRTLVRSVTDFHVLARKDGIFVVSRRISTAFYVGQLRSENQCISLSPHFFHLLSPSTMRQPKEKVGALHLQPRQHSENQSRMPLLLETVTNSGKIGQKSSRLVQSCSNRVTSIY